MCHAQNTISSPSHILVLELLHHAKKESTFIMPTFAPWLSLSPLSLSLSQGKEPSIKTS